MKHCQRPVRHLSYTELFFSYLISDYMECGLMGFEVINLTEFLHYSIPSWRWNQHVHPRLLFLCIWVHVIYNTEQKPVIAKHLFRRRSINCRKVLIHFVRPSVSLSICPHTSARIYVKFDIGDFYENLFRNYFVEFGQEYLILYTNTWVYLLLPAILNRHSALFLSQNLWGC